MAHVRELGEVPLLRSELGRCGQPVKGPLSRRDRPLRVKSKTRSEADAEAWLVNARMVRLNAQRPAIWRRQISQ